MSVPPSNRRAQQATNAALDRIIQENAERFEAAIKQLERTILRYVARINEGTSDATFTTVTYANVYADLVKAYEATYGRAVTETINGYPSIAKLALDTVNSLLDEADRSSVEFIGPTARDLKTLAEIDAQVYHSLGRTTVNRIALDTYKHLLSGAKLESLELDISAALTGYLDKRGLPLAVHAKTYAQDLVMQFHSRANLKAGKLARATKWLYVGDVIEGTRPFCEENVGIARSYAEWQEIGASESWKGKSCSDFMICRGGYNCRHHLQPVFE